MGIPTAPFVIHFALNTGHQIKLSSPSHLVFLPSPPWTPLAKLVACYFYRVWVGRRRFVGTKFVRMCAGNSKYNNKQQGTEIRKGVKRSEKPIKLRQNRVVISMDIKIIGREWKKREIFAAESAACNNQSNLVSITEGRKGRLANYLTRRAEYFRKLHLH